jgi:protease I
VKVIQRTRLRLGEVRAKRRGNARRARAAKVGVFVGKRIAILVSHGFDELELTETQHALENEGAWTDIISPAQKLVWGWAPHGGRKVLWVDVPLSRADPNEYDCLFLPGGVMSPDALRCHSGALQFVRDFFESSRTVGAICHAPAVLISADVVQGRAMTSCAAIRPDLQNAGAIWLDQEVVVDGLLVTSRKVADIPTFSARLIEVLHREADLGIST